ncbi:MAG: hypothetical protein AAF569_01430 [Pseudomonadota bacterium]
MPRDIQITDQDGQLAELLTDKGVLSVHESADGRKYLKLDGSILKLGADYKHSNVLSHSVLALLIQNKGKVVSHDDLLDAMEQAVHRYDTDEYDPLIYANLYKRITILKDWLGRIGLNNLISSHRGEGYCVDDPEKKDQPFLAVETPWGKLEAFRENGREIISFCKKKTDSKVELFSQHRLRKSLRKILVDLMHHVGEPRTQKDTNLGLHQYSQYISELRKAFREQGVPDKELIETIPPHINGLGMASYKLNGIKVVLQ